MEEKNAPDDFDAHQQFSSEGLINRWIPAVVVMSAIIGFIALAWYAYHAGMQSVDEDDLLVVEADKTPLKEKPDDPGGMKFPNQDKTIFDTFASQNAQTPGKVERVLPAPEEPVITKSDGDETTTWVNEKTQDTNAPAAGNAPVNKPTAVEMPLKEVKAPDPAPANTANIESYTRDSDTPPAKVDAATKPLEQPAASVVVSKPESAKAESKKSTLVKQVNVAVKVQLAAFKSEKEAQDSWTKLQKKFDSLKGKVPLVVKADLGSKGIYYRLRLSGFVSADEAKAFCSGLSAKGQACVLVAK